MMPSASHSTSPLRHSPPGIKPLGLLYACTCLIIATLIGAAVAVSLNLRESTLRNSEANLHNLSLALAEQADRAVQGVDLVLKNMAEYVAAEGADNGAEFRPRMAVRGVHTMLREKLVGLPYINALTMIDATGNLINFSRYWPIPTVNIADRDYFAALRADPKLARFVSIPVQNRGDNAWTVYLARRVPSRDGSFIGLLLGAIELRYFEEIYRSVSLGEGGAISLMRQDGVQLMRFPAGGSIGQAYPQGGPRVLQGAANGVIRDISPVDGAMRLKAAATLANFPMLVLVTQTETAALRNWHHEVFLLGLVTAGCAMAILIAGLAIARWWKQQQALSRARSEHAEAEHARALAEADLARERERHAEGENRAKSGFLAMMSHEIRTPMNAVLGLAGSLLDGPLAPQQREVVKAIRDAGDSLLRILNDILDFSKLDAGRMTFETAPFAPATLTQNAVSILGPRARAKGLAIVADTDPALPPALLGDAGRIRQILLNLVSNAVKFTQTGQVSIEARRVPAEDGRVGIEWAVRDTGIGVPPDRLDSLFGEFVQADSSISRRFGGSGLGLAISKRLVEQMGGAIRVESVVGQGTIFSFRLALPVAEIADDGPILSPADAAQALAGWLAALGRKLRVLFAEDNPTNQFVARQMLSTLPVQVDVVADGLEAVDAASSFAYDVIFMDMRMPEMDGLTATRLIRQRGGVLAQVPIIALTANAFPEDVQACFAAGMNQFVTKPVSKDVLFATILRALSPPDLAPAHLVPPDLAPPDLAPPDLAPPDLAPPDLAPPDLAPPDLAPVPAGEAVPQAVPQPPQPPCAAVAEPESVAERAPAPAISEVPPAASAAEPWRVPRATSPPIAERAPPAGGSAPVPFDAAALNALGEDIGHDGVGEMLEVFRQETRSRLQRMAQPGHPPATLMREAHTLKGAAGTVCAPLLQRRAEAIEQRLRAGGNFVPADLAGLNEAFDAFTGAVATAGLVAAPAL
jgi:hypothetical protein